MFVLLYALVGYGSFLGVMAALVLWLQALQTPAAATGPLGWALLADLSLIAVFALQHTVMARAPFKAWLTRSLPPAAERATYVIASNLALAVLMLGWQRLPGRIWSVEGPLAWALLAAATAGWIVGVLATFQFDHWSLFGLRQALAHRRRTAPLDDPPFQVPPLYRHVRHPMMSGFLLAFWMTPLMSTDRLVLAAGVTVYVLIGLRFEERALHRRYGQRYADYAARTPALLPLPRLLTVTRDRASPPTT